MKITANRLTLLRILLLPVPCVLLYGGPSAKLTALGIGSLLGLTDYFDGLLARREGVTRLGAFLDPIADKVFVAAIYLFLVKLGLLPGWLVGVLLMREFLVAALRPKVPGSLPVTWLAKVKTAFQMLSAALIIALSAYPAYALYFLGGASVVVLLGAVFSPFSFPRRLILVGLSLSFPLLSLLPPGKQALLLGVAALAITWFSAAPYLFASLKHLNLEDLFGLLLKVLFPLLAVFYLSRAGIFWPLLPVIVALEFIREGFSLLGARKDEMTYWVLVFLGLPFLLLPAKLTPAYLLLLFIYQVAEVLKLFLEKRGELLG